MKRTSSFDVAVVGGGAAGCVVAARLAESGARSLVLLEAGPDLRANTPEELHDGWGISRTFDWGFESEPGESGEVAPLRRGKLLGGTSWSTRFVLRGSPADFEQWTASGNVGWGFDDVLPYFVRLETDADFGDEPWHGDHGPIPVDRYRTLPLTDIAEAGLGAMLAAGFPAVEDHNRPGAVGAGRMPMNSRGGTRVSAADAYLSPDGQSANLTIRADTHVSEVVFDGTRARGVRLADGSEVEAGWVVLCAGTYASPTILMRSGIGPADHLRAVGLPVLVDLPGVGSNLADHPAVDIVCGYEGVARTAPLLHLIATFHSSTAPTEGAPDLMLWTSDPAAAPGEAPELSVDVVLLKPRSRGHLRLRSADPFAPPRITLPGVRDTADLERLAEGYLRAWEVVNQPEVRRLCGDLPSPTFEPGGSIDAIGATSYSIPHVVGTCAMGGSPEAGAVVDASGSVYGVERLSVVDASIIRDAPSGFPHIITIMLAERLADVIASSI